MNNPHSKLNLETNTISNIYTESILSPVLCRLFHNYNNNHDVFENRMNLYLSTVKYSVDNTYKKWRYYFIAISLATDTPSNF